MVFTKKEFPKIDESYYEGTHASGLRVYVIPKNHGTSYAAFATKFGSIDNNFRLGGEEKALPDGIAHFLEHKLFENEDGTDTFSRYAEYGGSANAYTSSDSTVYLFSAADNVKENLGILLDFVTHPYFTDETVQKEMGIIGEEIRMYDDNSGWRLYFNLMRAMFRDNPVRIDTAGTEKTIAEITPEKLFLAYKSFYNLHNMALVVCGSISPDDVAEVCDKYLPEKEVEKPIVERIYPDEQTAVFKKEIVQKMQVASPMVNIGIKDAHSYLYGEELAKRSAVYSIVLDVMFGRSSEFYTKYYEKGIVNSTFSASDDLHERFSYCIIGGNTDYPDEMCSAVFEEIERFVKDGIPAEDFERVKRKLYALSIRVFNSTDSIANSFLGFKFCGADLFDYPATIASVTLDEANALLREAFLPERFTVSKILPLD